MYLISYKYKGESGLTLVEIMVVVAIIALIVTMTVPNFIRAAKKARKTTCINNLKQLSDAAELYLFDYPDVKGTDLLDPQLLCGDKYIKEDISEIFCPEGKVSYPAFYPNLGAVCPNGPTTTNPAGNGTFPEHFWKKRY